jgi:hypothetical protein
LLSPVPVAYVCNTATGTLNKYEHYEIDEGMPSSESDSRFNDSEVVVSTLPANVSSCDLPAGKALMMLMCAKTCWSLNSRSRGRTATSKRSSDCAKKCRWIVGYEDRTTIATITRARLCVDGSYSSSSSARSAHSPCACKARGHQGPMFQIQEYRATAAARVGLEYWAYRVVDDNTIDCPDPIPEVISLDNHAGLRGFQVLVSCERAGEEPNFVYAVRAEGRGGTYGSPDFVRRELTRRIAPATNTGTTPTPGVYE